jgi:hypothetical protein
MSRNIMLSRDEAEYLVDLLEAQPPHHLAAQLAVDLREEFGMATKERQKEFEQAATSHG